MLGMTNPGATMGRNRGNVFQCSFTLPAETAKDISYIAKRMGISQSALLAQLMAKPIADLRALIDLVPDLKSATPDQVLRFRGASADVIADLVRDAMKSIAGVRS